MSEETSAVAAVKDDAKKSSLSPELIGENISLLARTGNGLSFAYVRFELHGKPIQDLDALESFPNLRYVDVSENALVNISGISHLEYILSLDVHGNQIATVPASIDKRKYLQHANFSKNKIHTWDVLRWPLLSWLNLNENLLTQLKLEDFSELVHVEARANRLEQIGHLNTPKLQRLYLAANNIKTVSGLENKHFLTILHLRGNSIETLDGFTHDLKKLTYLNLRDNRIMSKNEISKLNVLPALKILILSGNPIDQIPNYRLEVIARCPKLEKLDKEAITPEEREEAIQFLEQAMKEAEAAKEQEAM